MAVKMRLTRLGDKRAPFYRIVVADSRVSRDAKYIDLVGTYNPLTKPEEIKFDNEKALKWLNNGAEPTPTVKALLKKAGVEKTKKTKAEKKAKVEKTEAVEAVEEKPAKKTTTRKTAAKKESK